VRVDFDYPNPGERTRDFVEAFVLLDPAHHWAIKEYGATQPESGAVHHTTIAFGESVNEFPIPKTVTQRIWPKKDPQSIYQIVAKVELIAEDVTEAEFHLSHYDLPEPKFSRSWIGSWAWYLLGGVVCLAIGAIAIRRRKSRA
jgi:hypothetical protein